ncbi:MAG: hypothetical protein HKN41_06880, partial [Ilumatobacter sp.]|nr:hypothetical protein [Ilumatobacter sp.]
MRRQRARSGSLSLLTGLLVVAATTLGTPAHAAAGSTWDTWVSSPDDPAVRLSSRAASTSAPTIRVLVDPVERHQTWTGVGASLTDSSVELMTPEIVDRLYDPLEPQGAHLNLLRLPLSATDFSAEGWTWDWNDRRGEVTPATP